MYRSPNYPTDEAAIDGFVAGQRHGYLIATPPGGHPQVSILPFVKRGGQIDIHIVQADETFAAVQANPLVTFFVSDFLAFSPHDWVNPRDAGRATLHFAAVNFACEATTSTDPDEVARTLRDLIANYEPGATGYEPLADGDFYGPHLRRLAAVHLRILHAEAKFKVGPAAPAAVRLQVASHLRERNEPGDSRAATAIEAATPLV